MRVLAISGSLRKGSTNTATLEALARLASDGVRVLVYRDLAKLPPFNPDDDVEGGPFPSRSGTCGRSSPRATRSSSPRRNTPTDCRECSRTRSTGWSRARHSPASGWRSINVSPRAFHAQADLREILATMAARFVPEAFATLSLTGKAVTAEDILMDPVAARRLKESIEALTAAMREG